MTLVKFNPALPSLVENFLNRDFNYVAPTFQGNHVFGSLPAVNVLETTEGFTIEVAAPGLNKEDFSLNLQQNTLSISVNKATETTEGIPAEGKPKYTRREFNFQSFKRTFTLPQTVDGERIQASYINGILQIQLPKKEEAKSKSPRTIEIV
jgi:HSP20 family protein